MINQEYDDEGTTDETLTDEPIKAKGDFSRMFLGHEVWFRNAAAGQLTALRRLQAQSQMRVNTMRKTLSPEEVWEQASRLSFDFDNSCLELVESLIVDPDDITFLTNAQLRGEVQAVEIIGILFKAEAPDDSETPEPVIKKRPPAKKAVAKKVANANRTRK